MTRSMEVSPAAVPATAPQDGEVLVLLGLDRSPGMDATHVDCAGRRRQRRQMVPTDRQVSSKCISGSLFSQVAENEGLLGSTPCHDRDV